MKKNYLITNFQKYERESLKTFITSKILKK